MLININIEFAGNILTRQTANTTVHVQLPSMSNFPRVVFHKKSLSHSRTLLFTRINYSSLGAWTKFQLNLDSKDENF